jgi:eukaryotic-like serine/threonine-protein kinase
MAAGGLVLACPECGLTYQSAVRCTFDGSVVVETETDPLVGRTIASYEILERLDQGGIAVLYRARDLDNDREVALKLLLGEMASSPVLTERFRREALAMTLIRHANVAKVYEFSRNRPGLTYLVMELLRGEPLSAVLARGPIAKERALKVALHVARGLMAAHEHGFVHRDVTPSNIMLVDCDGEETAKLLDFNLVALDYDDAPLNRRLTSAGTVVGTPVYVAPEVACGDPPTPSADLYSLGVVLYEMLAGRPPFVGRVQELFEAHLTKPPPPLARDEGLERLALALLRKKPDSRPPSAEAVVRELEQI